MAAEENLLWDAADKGMRMLPRLRRAAVAAGFLGLFALVLWVSSDVRWAVYAVVAYVLAETAYWVWDGRRLVEVRNVPGDSGGPARIRVRRVGGRITEYDPRTVTRVLIIRDNVIADSAKLRLNLGLRLAFGRPGRPPAPAAWREACPRAEVKARGALWGMPGVPD